MRTASIKPSRQLFGQPVSIQSKAAAAKNPVIENKGTSTEEKVNQKEQDEDFDPEMSKIEEMSDDDKKAIHKTKKKDETEEFEVW